MVTLIFPYRNRDLSRLENSLNSLEIQTATKFEVIFVDYGSNRETAMKARLLCEQYSFVKYIYHFTGHQPWNKSRALNSVIKNLKTEYCFVADVDLIFHPKFVEKALQLQDGNKSIYFQVGFLPKGVEGLQDHFISKNYRKSTREATGLSMFPVKVLKDLRGFDEFYHFWGAEDTDMHARIRNAGYEVEFYEEVWLLHQWHPSYRSTEKRRLTQELQIKGIVQLNHQHLKWAIKNKVTITNLKGWGEVMNQKDLELLEQSKKNIRLDNEKKKIDDLLYGQFPSFKNRTIKVELKKSDYQKSLKYKVKRLLGRKVPEYYSLKEANDLIITHLIFMYRSRAYIYKVNEDLDKITFGIKF